MSDLEHGVCAGGSGSLSLDICVKTRVYADLNNIVYLGCTRRIIDGSNTDHLSVCLCAQLAGGICLLRGILFRNFGPRIPGLHTREFDVLEHIATQLLNLVRVAGFGDSCQFQRAAFNQLQVIDCAALIRECDCKPRVLRDSFHGIKRAVRHCVR